jgi:cbb3-type cytochrome oxidase maturation protein
MSILFVLIPLGLMLLVLALWAFFWAVDHDQFEDLDRPAHSILFDDDLADGAGKKPAAAEPPSQQERDT